MSKQVALRLPDDLVAYLDQAVVDGVAASRAALVTRALQREIRYQAAVRDAEILQRSGAADDLDTLVTWTSSRVELDD